MDSLAGKAFGPRRELHHCHRVLDRESLATGMVFEALAAGSHPG